MQDPFASAPADEAQAPSAPEPAKKAAPKKSITVDVKPNILPVGEGKVVVTLKGGSGFDAPWIVIHAASVEDAEAQLDANLAKLMEKAQKAASHFTGLGVFNGGPPTRQERQPAPAEAQGAPSGETRVCRHGDMRFKSGISKAGKPYQAFFCPSGDRNDECKAQFLR
jgi:hypothetical protein